MIEEPVELRQAAKQRLINVYNSSGCYGTGSGSGFEIRNQIRIRNLKPDPDTEKIMIMI